MVGYDPEQSQVPWWIISLAGASSGLVTRASTQPLDVIKIRLQIQDAPFDSKKVKYTSVLQTIKRIISEEGLGALWKGHNPAQVLSLSYGFLQFGGFELITKLTHPLFQSYSFLQPFHFFTCGCLAGGFATFISYPFDLIRTRFIVQDFPPVYTSMYQTLKIVVQNESPRGLYKGFLPTFVQIVPNTGLQFAFYNFFSTIWNYFISKNRPLEDNFVHHPSVFKGLVCGSLAGFCAKTVIYPLDFAKKRMQVNGVHTYALTIIGKDQNYKGLIHCLSKVVREEGFFALYKGFVASTLKAFTTSAIIFSSYEQFTYLFILAYNSFKTS